MVVADGGVGTVLVCAMLSATENIERKIVVTLTTSDNTGEFNRITLDNVLVLFCVCALP